LAQAFGSDFENSFRLWHQDSRIAGMSQRPSKRETRRRLLTSSLALGALAAGRFLGQRSFEAFSMTNVAAPVRGPWRSLKQKLGSHPTQASIAALEGTTPQCLVSSIQDLEGTWHVTSPQENAQKGLLHGDVPRMLLNLYTGDIGRMLSMDVVASPVLHIAADGRTTTETQLRWGQQQDHITLQGRLQLVGPNRLREKPKATRSDALKLTMPAMQRDREMNITYFDGSLLILRDSRGIVDVLWREEMELVEEDEDLPPLDPAGSAPPTPVNQVESLLVNVKTLSNSLEELRNQSSRDKKVRLTLSDEIVRLEKELDTVTAAARADSVAVKAIERLGEKVSGIFEAQKEKTNEKTQNYDAMQLEMASLRARAEELESNVSRFRVRESNLKEEMQVLQSDRRAGKRHSDEAAAYRAAMEKAHDELRTVRNELKSATKEVGRLSHQLREKSVELDRVQKAMGAEIDARKRTKDQLDDQQRGYEEARQRLARAGEVEAALRQELANVRSELEDLEEREAKSNEMAADIEEEMNQLADRVREAKKTMNDLGEKKKRRFWPFR